MITKIYMWKHIKWPQESYVADKVSEKWFDSKEIEKIKQAKKEQLLRQIDNYCWITWENFDYKKCEKLIREIIKIFPSEKEHFERAKEMFKNDT